MIKMKKIKSDKLGKLEYSADITAGRYNPDDIVEAIFKVSKTDYVPDRVKVRARIDATMFTGEVTYGLLEELEQDPNVESLSVSKRLRILK
jgi:hypothetical protein